MLKSQIITIKTRDMATSMKPDTNRLLNVKINQLGVKCLISMQIQPRVNIAHTQVAMSNFITLINLVLLALHSMLTDMEILVLRISKCKLPDPPHQPRRVPVNDWQRSPRGRPPINISTNVQRPRQPYRQTAMQTNTNHGRLN